MRSLFDGELRVPHWMRALSLLDPAAPYSNRSDHGPAGAYIGWPALTINTLGQQGDYEEALAFTVDTAFVATLGPYGQAVEIRPPGPPYKPMVFTLYNELVGISMADAIVTTLFGFAPPPLLGGSPAGITPLVDAGIGRGFNGTLWNVQFAGSVGAIVSEATAGLSWVPQA